METEKPARTSKPGITSGEWPQLPGAGSGPSGSTGEQRKKPKERPTKKGPGIITEALEAICIIDRSHGSRADTETCTQKTCHRKDAQAIKPATGFFYRRTHLNYTPFERRWQPQIIGATFLMHSRKRGTLY